MVIPAFGIERRVITAIIGAMASEDLDAEQEPESRDPTQAQLRAILDSSLDGLITIDARGNIVEFNRAAERIFGYARADVLGREMATMIVPPSMREAHRRGMSHAIATGDAPILGRRIEIAGMRADGSEFPVELTVTRVPLESRVLFTGSLRDITERKRIENRRSAQYSATRILSTAPTLDRAMPEVIAAICHALGWELGQLWLLSADGKALRLRSGWAAGRVDTTEFENMSRDLEFPRKVGLPGTVWDTEKGAWLEDVTENSNFPRAQAARASRIRTGFACPIVSAGRFLGVLEFFSTDRRTDDPDLVELVEAVGRQVGDFIVRKNAEHEVRESEERYRRMMETTNEGIWWIDQGAKTIYANARLGQMFGIPAAELVGRPIFDFVDPPQHSRAQDMFERRRRGMSDRFDVRFRRADGTTLWALVSSAPLEDASGAFAGAFAMVTDINERKRAEEADHFLVEAARLLASSLDDEVTLRRVAELAVPRVGDWCAVDLVGRDGRLGLLAAAHVDHEKTELARLLRERYPIEPEEPGGAAGVVRSGEPQMVEEITDAMLVASAKDPEQLELIRALGLTSWICVPLAARGRVFGTLSFATAESRRRYDQTDLRLAERIASLAAIAIDNARLYQEAQKAVRLRDDFLAVAGHELRTPLTRLSLDIHLLLNARPSAGRENANPRSAERAQRSIQRLTALIDELLDVSRISGGRLALVPEEVDLAELARDVVSRFSDERTKPPAGVILRANGPVVGFWDPHRLDQVIENLVSNAVKYGEQRPVEVDVGFAEEGGQAQIVVTDHGIGIDGRDHGRIFERFERAVSGQNFPGMGLGLWIVREIVHSSGGTVAVESGAGSGSKFTVRLPRRAPGGSAGDRPS